MSASKSKILTEFKKLQSQIMFDIDNTTGKNKLINQYRLKSILAAIKIIEKYNKDNISFDDLSDIFKIKGIGKGTIDRIKEIINTGKLSEVKITEEDKKYLKMIEELEEIYGIGRITAYKLFKEYRITSIEELIKKVNNKEIDVPENIKIGLKYVGKLDTQIPRKDIDEIHEYILDLLFEIDIDYFGTICGSYRRLKPTSGDVDLIITHQLYKKLDQQIEINLLDIVIKKLIENNIIIESLTRTDVKTKYMGIFRWKNSKPRRIDIRLIPLESYYPAILYFTGSKNFNTNMRLNAIAHDYTLNEYGLYDEKRKMFKVNSEKEIFDLLGMEYVTPDKR
jgi:DNA polymerase/3'-5' exonuclease PolX